MLVTEKHFHARAEPLGAAGPQGLGRGQTLSRPADLTDEPGIQGLPKQAIPHLQQLLRSLGEGPHLVAVCDGRGQVLASIATGCPTLAPGTSFAPPDGLSTTAAPIDGPIALTLHVAGPGPATPWQAALARYGAARLAGALHQTESNPFVYYDMICAVARFTAHALGNPLAGLSLTLELMAGVAQSSDVQRYLTRCNRVAERLAEFKEHLGVLGGALASEPQEVGSEGFVRDFLARQGLSSEYVTPIEIDPEAATMTCHPGVLSDALGYLVRNATDAAPAGCTLGFRVKKLPGYGVRLSVWDDGPGLPPEVATRAFKTPVTTKSHGGGLGFLLVGMIVEQIHGGRMSHEPRSPGTCFNLDLPERGRECRQGSAS